MYTVTDSAKFVWKTPPELPESTIRRLLQRQKICIIYLQQELKKQLQRLGRKIPDGESNLLQSVMKTPNTQWEWSPLDAKV